MKFTYVLLAMSVHSYMHGNMQGEHCGIGSVVMHVLAYQKVQAKCIHV